MTDATPAEIEAAVYGVAVGLGLAAYDEPIRTIGEAATFSVRRADLTTGDATRVASWAARYAVERERERIAAALLRDLRRVGATEAVTNAVLDLHPEAFALDA